MTDNNPLLQISTLPNKAPAFEKIKAEHYLPAVEEGIRQARANYDAIKNNSETPTFENTIVAMETAGETLDTVTSVFYNQLSCMGGDDLHELAEKIGPLTANFGSDIILDEKLFARVKDLYERIDTLGLNTEERTLLEDSYIGFVRGGALLDEDKKKRLREISEQLSTLSPNFMNNASKSAESFEMIIDNEADLSGLPQNAIDAAAFAAKEKGMEGKWRFTLDYPSYIPFVQYADKRELREKMWRAFANRAYGDQYDNCENILKIVKLKHERANLLGYKTHAEYVLERRMAEKPENVLAFLDKLKATYKPSALKDLERLKSFAEEYNQSHPLPNPPPSRGREEDVQASEGGGQFTLQPWDIGYYSEKLKQKLFDFSSEDFRPYLPLDNVLKGTFEHFEKLFNITFDKASGYEVWHKDVQVFDVKDKGNGKFIGTLFADFFPRTGKKQGAWMTAYRSQGLYNGKVERPVIAIVCNFTKPAGDKPALLTHDEVTTLFHEMGHAIHGLLSDVTYQSHSGTSVLWDFVELPSQLQENWCYEKETLDMFAEHFETGEKIPEDLINKLRASMHFMNGWGGLRQVSLGTLDMAWHTADPSAIQDVAEFEDEAVKDCALFPRLAGPTSSSFSHIFAGGYSAGYYSYKWAEVLDADTFELFKENGLYDAKAAQSYRDNILAKGGTEKPSVLYQNFRGRDADADALLRREGLLDSDEKAA